MSIVEEQYRHIVTQQREIVALKEQTSAQGQRIAALEQQNAWLKHEAAERVRKVLLTAFYKQQLTEARRLLTGVPGELMSFRAIIHPLAEEKRRELQERADAIDALLATDPALGAPEKEPRG